MWNVSMKINTFSIHYPQYTQKSEHLTESTLFTQCHLITYDLTPFECIHTFTQLCFFKPSFQQANIWDITVALTEMAFRNQLSFALM